jgi:hypothetical protein
MASWKFEDEVLTSDMVQQSLKDGCCMETARPFIKLGKWDGSFVFSFG